jgi:hypothetical protein
MIQLAIALQLGALLAFVLAFIDRKFEDNHTPIVGRTYDYYIHPTRGGSYYAQQKVIEVKDGYVRCEHILYEPAHSREEIETLDDFRRHNTLIIPKQNPFETTPVITNPPDAGSHKP